MGKWRRNKSLTRRWQRNALIKKFGAICYICLLPFKNMKDITFDHLIPVIKGGLDEFDNYRLAHQNCNLLKGEMTPEQFEEFQKGGTKVE